MTREEAIRELKIQFVGEYDRQREAKDMAIKALELLTSYEQTINKLTEAISEQATILDKIRDEIEELDRYYDNDYFSTNNCPMYKCNEVLLIIDKYRGEA